MGSHLNFVGEFNIGISVAESSNVGHLGVGELQQRVTVVIFHFHDVEHLIQDMKIHKANYSRV